MTYPSALRNSIVCGIAVAALAGCGAARAIGVASTPDAGTGGATPPAASASAVPSATPDTNGVSAQINSIDNQLSTIESQMNAANSGLSTSEGDPSQ